MTTPHQTIIDANRDRARQLLADAGPEGLTGEALTEFEACESRARAHADQETRGNQLGNLGGLTGALDDGHEPAPVMSRAIGNLPAIDFDPADMRELHARTIGGSTNGPLQINAHQRAIPSPGGNWSETPPTTVAPHRIEPTRIAALIPTQTIESSVATYYRQSAAASAAAIVAEGGDKPESSPGWEPVEEPVLKIAHWTEVSTEALADYANFEGIIHEAMIGGLVKTENLQVLSGDGTGTPPNMKGLLNRTGILTVEPLTVEPRLYSILDAITALRTDDAFTEADTIVLHPQDWAAIAKMETDDKALVVSPTPTAGTARSLWGVPVTLTTGIDAGTALVANLAAAAIVFSRLPARIFVDPFSQSTRNMVRFVAEERLALGTPNTEALVKVTFKTS